METQELIEVGIKLMSDVRDEHKFYSVDGKVLKNIHDLVALLDTIQDEHFSHHVTETRNDFALWIENCIGDLDLALKIKDAPDSSTIKNLIKERLEVVENALLDYEHNIVVEKQGITKSKIDVSQKKPKKQSKKSKKALEQQLTPPTEGSFGHSDILYEIERAINETKQRTEALEKAVIDNDTAIDAVHAASQKQGMLTINRKFYWGDFIIGFSFGLILGIIVTAIYYGFIV
jgi:hypothetical protein